jgi:type II secretory pathway component GspD/PulD (secretin)
LVLIFVDSQTCIAQNKTKIKTKSHKKHLKTTKTIPLKTISYSTVDVICRPMLSKQGTMAFLKEKNSVFIFDFKENVKKIQNTIAKMDTEVVNIRIKVDFLEQNNSVNDNVNVKVKYKGLPGTGARVIVKDGKVVQPNKITFGAFRRRGVGHRNTSQFILTRSGSPAQIWSGKTIVDPSWLANYPLQPTLVFMGNGGTVVIPGSDNDVVWTDIGASLFVLPKYLGNGKIDVEVYPVVSYIVDEDDFSSNKRNRPRTNRRAVKVADISTHLTLQNGQRVSLGGIVSSNKDFFTNFFGPELLSRTAQNSILNMYITATVIDPSGRVIGRRESRKKSIDEDLNLDDIINSKEDPGKIHRYR